MGFRSAAVRAAKELRYEDNIDYRSYTHSLRSCKIKDRKIFNA